MPKKKVLQEKISSQIILFLRNKRGMTTKEIALLIDKTPNYVTCVASGKTPLTLESVNALSKGLKIPFYILGYLSTEISNEKDNKEGNGRCCIHEGEYYCGNCGSEMIRYEKYKCPRCSNEVAI